MITAITIRRTAIQEVTAEAIGQWFPHEISHLEIEEPGMKPNRRWVIEPRYDYYLVRVPRA